MDPADLTPRQARAASYDHVLVHHCQMTVVVWADGLPARPLSEMRFRCSRCGSSLTAAQAGARWAGTATAPFSYPRC